MSVMPLAEAKWNENENEKAEVAISWQLRGIHGFLGIYVAALSCESRLAWLLCRGHTFA